MVDKRLKFINKALLIHDNLYDYSLVEYINDKIKVKIICSEHGIFEQRPNNHLNLKHGCPKCNDIKKLLMCKENNINKNLIVKNNFIIESNLKHSNKYDYSLTNYINAFINVKIICQIHGIFEQSPHNHKFGQGCPICKTSKGEKVIRLFLVNNNINFSHQHRFPDCKDKRPLPFDFYLPDLNMCIEFNGRQHYEIIKNWGGIEGFEDQQKKDKIKTEYCVKNNIKLITIKHDEQILSKLLNLNFK